MTRLKWNDNTRRAYEVGADRGVYYPIDGPGEVWNGLTSVQESPSDDGISEHYLDGTKVQQRRRVGELEGVIEAYTYPEALTVAPRRFGLSYRAKTDTSYKIHLVYNVLAMPSDYSHQYDEVEPFSWSFTTKPVDIPGATASAHLIIDASQAYPSTITALEDFLYGSELESPRLPTPNELLTIFEETSLLRVVDNGDGSFTVTGPDDAIQMLDATTFQITWPSAIFIDDVSYTISSL